MTTGLRPDRGRHLARRIERHLASSPEGCVSRDEFRALADDVLGDYHREETAERIRESFERSNAPWSS